MIVNMQINDQPHLYIQHTLEKPVIHLEDWFKMFDLYCLSVEQASISCKNHFVACQHAFLQLKQATLPTDSPLLMGITLRFWGHILYQLLANSNLVAMLGYARCRELLCFSFLFTNNDRWCKAMINIPPQTLADMIKAIVWHNFLKPTKEPTLTVWKAIRKVFIHQLPPKVISYIYTYLFIPPALNITYQEEFISKLTKLDIRPYLQHWHQPIRTLPAKAAYQPNTPIDPALLLIFLLHHRFFTLIDIITAIKPLPYNKLRELFASASYEQRAALIDQLHTYVITRNQKNKLEWLIQHTEPSENPAPNDQIQFWLDVCHKIYDDNVMRMAKRQQQIRYLCQSPLGNTSLKKTLLHFKTTVTNTEQWLQNFSIDCYAFKHPANTQEHLFEIGGHHVLAKSLLHRLFSPKLQSPINCYDQHQAKFSEKIHSLLNKHTHPKINWWATWFKNEVSCQKHQHLVSKLNHLFKDYAYETDFTQMISFMRHTVEKQSCLCCRDGKLLFHEINVIDSMSFGLNSQM